MALELTPEFWDRLARQDKLAWDQFLAEFDTICRGVPRWKKWKFNPEVQKDVAQDIRIAIHNSLPDLRGQAQVAGFIKRIAVNKCIDQIRRQVRRNLVFADLLPLGDGEGDRAWEPVDVSGQFDPIRKIQIQEMVRALRGLVQELGQTCQQAVDWHYLQGIPYAEIAEKLGISVNTVGSRLAKCLEKFRGMLKKSAQFREYFGNPGDCDPESTS